MRRLNKKNIRVFINPCSNYGKSLRQWETIKDEVRTRMGKLETEQILNPVEIIPEISKSLKRGEDIFIAAGGDGTVNLLLNAIMQAGGDRDVTIGAVGLGSSNDFHKPFGEDAFIKGVPVKIDFKNAFPRDVIRIRYRNATGHPDTRYCLINASAGLTAEANAFFNLHGSFMKI
ncbi:MAG: acylglycerol kinase family protein, partial [candidate division WOR-3 bacterium]